MLEDDLHLGDLRQGEYRDDLKTVQMEIVARGGCLSKIISFMHMKMMQH